ncbi:hypothetical protein P0D73_19750 [Paraburkholderia sp. RL18-101-BIB-B]|uniref:hypothetical protein n=1 Tax=Paraburkholderia sp. RL18-101-BIB-B TaxID=3031634 RepID=UPI0038B87DAB
MNSLAICMARASVAVLSRESLRWAFAVATGFLFAEVAYAVECAPAKSVLQQTQQAGYKRLLVANVLSIGDSEANAPEVVGGRKMTAREAIEIEVNIAQKAVTYAQRAVQQSDIQRARSTSLLSICASYYSSRLKSMAPARGPLEF